MPKKKQGGRPSFIYDTEHIDVNSIDMPNYEKWFRHFSPLLLVLYELHKGRGHAETPTNRELILSDARIVYHFLSAVRQDDRFKGKTTFYELGYCVGNNLVIAHDLGFKLQGIEISEAKRNAALKVLKEWDPDISPRLFLGDYKQWIYPRGNDVIFYIYPYDVEELSAILPHLQLGQSIIIYQDHPEMTSRMGQMGFAPELYKAYHTLDMREKPIAIYVCLYRKIR